MLICQVTLFNEISELHTHYQASKSSNICFDLVQQSIITLIIMIMIMMVEETYQFHF